MSANTHILIVEDDRNLAVGLRSALKSSGFAVSWADSGMAAMSTLRSGMQPDLILSDVMMKGSDGFALRQNLAKLPSAAEIPFIYLTAKSDVASRIYGLDLGADDYIVKPFDVAELVARVRAVLRRYEPRAAEQTAPQYISQDKVSSRDLQLDVSNGELTMPTGVSLSLTPSESAIMQVLMRHPGRPFGRDDLVREALGYFPDEDAKALINTHIYNIRVKMRDSAKRTFVRSKRNWGYYVD